MTDTSQPGTSTDPPTPDDVLWNRIRAGDEQALGELFDRYADDVHAFAFRRTASWAIAEDVVQTTFVSTWQRLMRRDPGPLRGESARGWLLVVAGNECRNHFRAVQRLKALVQRVSAPADAPDPAADVARRLDDERRMSEVRRALAKLPAHERDTRSSWWSGPA
ncbi:RNA polymerase sigma factor [Kribbella sp. NBC_01245]|uniref:RNA polymerase sigma factor n=1 Tax=Kribbella sp. NBC_01245 TaxID=2903578 RepID=UPI002E2856F6|nr:RNA polymerase sigma factor [Kribbella sp. NBC_01245]